VENAGFRIWGYRGVGREAREETTRGRGGGRAGEREGGRAGGS
jgi:hypothetical protein